MEENQAKKAFSRMGFAHLAGIAATMIVSALVLVPLVKEANMQKITDAVGPSALLLMIYVPQIAYLLLFWLVVRPMPVPDWEKGKFSFGTLVKIFLMMYSVSSILNYLGLMIAKSAPAGGVEQLDLIQKMESTKLPVAIMIPVVIGPILEELIFRKLMLDRTRCYGEKTAIIFSAICFGLFHENLTQFLYAGCVGLSLGYVYCKTGNVLYTMIMHMLLNGFSSGIMAVVPLVESGNPDVQTAAFIGILVLILGICVMMISGIVLLVRWIKNRSFILDDSMPDCIPQNEVFKTVYLNPGVILFFAVSILGIIADLFNLDLSPKFF